MPAKTTTVPKLLIPYEAGVSIVTPLDLNKRPNLIRSVATQHNFLSQTQLSETKTTEELENGNGQNKTMVTSVVYNLSVVANVLNIVYHNMVAGRIESLPDRTLVMDEFTWFLPETAPEEGLTITFGVDADHATEPAADENGEYWFIVEDSYGNPLVRLDTPEFGAYSWDKDLKQLRFSDEYAGAAIRVIYRYASTNSIRYDSNPILSQPEFQLDNFGIMSDAESGRKFRVHERLLRATQTGDLSGMPTQRSISSPITYTFQSSPVPSGVSVYSVTYTPIDGNGNATGESFTNWVNGGDDKFDSAVAPARMKARME